MMRRLLTTTIFMAAVSLEATAIDANGARQVAADVYQEIHGVSAAECPAMQVIAIDSLHAAPSYYVCQPLQGPGYFIISAIEGTPELIAYSETGEYQHGLPSPFRALLSDYAERLSGHPARTDEPCAASGNASVTPRPASPRYAPVINPLIQTYWAQGNPYNLLCPSQGDEHCLTGCGATAMAQVMNYHRYPAVGTGIADGATMNKQRLEAIDLSQYPFDWDSMLDSYQKVDYTDTQANAVATLMMTCGYAAQMMYDLSASNSYIAYVRKALIENFGYSTTTRIYLRDSYERSSWLDLLHAELEAGRPIIYMGQSVSSGGHIFVCDGWGVRNTVHVNWGWGEGSGITVDVDVMAPRGSNDGYTGDMMCIAGIQPMVEGEDRTLPCNLSLCDSLRFTPSNKIFGIPSVYNSCPGPITLNFGFCIRQDNEVIDYIDLNKNVYIGFGLYSQYIYGILSLPSLADGEYSLQMVVKPQGTSEWISVNPGDRADGFTFSISNGEMTFGELASIGTMEAEAASHAIESVSYDLSGTRCAADAQPRGFSIRDGRVIFVR